MEDSASLYEFLGIGELAETTTHMLSLNLHQTAHAGSSHRIELGPVEQVVLRQARDYLRKVREGFMLSVRTGQIAQIAELRYMLDQVLAGWSELNDVLDGEGAQAPSATGVNADGDSWGEAEREAQMEQVRHQLLAFGMAVVALGCLPRLPAKEITFPHSYGKPPTYSDIPVPATPGEMLWRIDELEQMVRRLMSDDLSALIQRRYGPLRRTYGFFEASAWLSHKEAERFGIKRRRDTLTFF